MRSVSRLVDVSINTVTRELVLAGQACADFHDRTVRNVQSKRVQADEIWSFVEMKEKLARTKAQRAAHIGDTWTWTGVDADSKLLVSWFIGSRNADAAWIFMQDLADRLANRVQLTTDGHNAYLDAVDGAFGTSIDYAMLVKSTVPRLSQSVDTAPRSASALSGALFTDGLTPTTFRLPTSSAPT